MSKTGKNKKSNIEYNGYTLDSTEELEFMWWVEECVEHGLIKPDWVYQPITYDLIPKSTVQVIKQLKTKQKLEWKTLYQGHTYDPDFKIQFTDKFYGFFNELPQPISIASSGYNGFRFIKPNQDIIIDVKGTFNKTARSFSTDQRLVYDKFGVIIHKIIPEKLFVKTFVPKKASVTPKKKEPRKKYLKTPLIEEFINDLLS